MDTEAIYQAVCAYGTALAMRDIEEAGHQKDEIKRLLKEAEDERAELLAENERLHDLAGGWRPIDSAPKDGRKLLLFYKNRNGLPRTVVAGWVTDEEAAETDEDGVGLEAGWYERIDNWDDYCQVAIHEGEPSHWMPLPPPPEDA